MIVATWQKCIYCLKQELPSQQFNTWIRPLRFINGNNTLYLLAPNKFILEWVKDHFLGRIEEIITENSQGETPIIILEIAAAEKLPADISLDQALSTADLTNVLEPEVDQPDQPDNRPHAEYSATPGALNNNQTTKLNVTDSFNNSLVSVTGRPAAPASSHKIQSPGTSPNSRKQRYKGELNPNYTFNNFIEGKSNQIARAASAQVADNPGGAYNPLFIYGGVGLGKTHLMHAIGNHLREQNPGANVVYLHSQTFVGSMVSALQLNAINEFKRYYHSVDALLIDDIQFFAKKERSQEEFFHTFNAIFESGRQIIMTCDKYHSEINGLEERLKSRFGWGLSVAVEPPELETRAAILINKANHEHVYLANEEAMFMAQKLRSNVRELEGALKKVIAHSRFMGSDISIPLIKEALKDLLAIQNKLISVDNIQRTVAEYYKIKMADMVSKRRNRSIARPRQIAMCLSKELTNHSLPEIGNLYGGRDHTTVLHACRTINDLRQSSTDINEDYQNLLRSLSS
ncbi:MAG: chromosomal replication initiator protein DnaA [Gammaproteobacteria bacterium]|nr:chromosomal replication initiator protein DnaA [Gammaproteobacteria bacterium]